MFSKFLINLVCFLFKKCYYSKHWNSSILGFCLIFCVVTLSYFNLKISMFHF